MPTPKLPQFSPPTIPTRRTSSSPEPKKGSNFFTIMLITMLLVWSFQLLTRKPEEPEKSLSEPTRETVEAVKIPTPEESKAIAETLSDEVKASSARAISPAFHSLGSADPKSPYRMLVTLSNRGASVTRIELNEKSYRDCSDPTGYLGQIIVDETLAAKEMEAGWPGVGVQTVGNGTPAHQAGLAVGDRIVSVKMVGKGGETVDETTDILSFDDLRNALLKTRPGRTVEFGILRKDVVEKLIAAAPAAPASGDEAGGGAESDGVSPDADAPKAEETSEVSQKGGAGDVSRISGAPLEADASKTFAFDPSQVENLTVTLAEAPLSVLRPMGMIAHYDDYKNLVGLQGGSSDYSGGEDVAEDVEDVFRRPNTDASSFLMTLASYDETDKLDWPIQPEGDSKGSVGRNAAIDRELPFYHFEGGELVPSESGLRDGYWELIESESNESKGVFRKILPDRRLELRKIYSLTPTEQSREGQKEENAPEYDLRLTVEARNLDPDRNHAVAYYLDGPTGLPVEGLWYSLGRKTGPKWGTYGLRDIVLKLGGNHFHVLRCGDVAMGKGRPSDPVQIDFIGVDSQYFQSSMIPESAEGGAALREYVPIRVGARLAKRETFTNVSFRMKSSEMKLAPAGQTGDVLSESYKIFAGPKKQSLLDAYGLGETLVYGWFWFVSKPLAALLHFFRHYMVFNYGLAIILLTVLVRLCLYPLSMKQVVSSMKMQKIQPELNALKERYKDKPQEMVQAQRELWKKHKINPLGGCLPLFIQMPIFIGLYKVLALDVNLYGAPLFTEKLRWCSNLAAPDMLVDWSEMWKSFGWSGFNLGNGMFALGPFFNLLPILTIVLFLVQQKLMMPPPTGTPEEQAQQRTMRRMMTFMMIFMGVMFFKVPSGLCVYFIASSLWGLLERRFHPKIDLAADSASAGVIDVASRNVSSGSSPSAKTLTAAGSKKSRGRYAGKAEEAPKGKIRAWWNDLVEKAKEQQKLAKAETEKRNKANRKRRYK